MCRQSKHGYRNFKYVDVKPEQVMEQDTSGRSKAAGFQKIVIIYS